jgi:cell division septal protein FtsQ
MKIPKQIFNLFVTILLILFIGYLVFFVNNDYKADAEKTVSISGNILLPENDYLVFTKLENRVDEKKLGASVIKSRFEKHPYIERARVELNGKNDIRITAVEKNIKAVIIVNSEPFLISDDYQVLPLFPNINSVDVPVISNIRTSEKVKELSYLKNNDMIQAFRIIDAAEALSNKQISRNLSEINFNSTLGARYENDIVLSFSGMKPAVITGRGDEARKMICLETLWENMSSGKLAVENNDYIDLRYANNVYFGSLTRGKIQ